MNSLIKGSAGDPDLYLLRYLLPVVVYRVKQKCLDPKALSIDGSLRITDGSGGELIVRHPGLSIQGSILTRFLGKF